MKSSYDYSDQYFTVNMLGAIVGPALFLSCPMDVEKSQQWFGDLWNSTIVPYLSQVYKEFTVRVCI